MTTPVSLQPWSWQIFILIKLWWQVFQMVVYGDIVDTQTWYWPWNLTVSSHLHMPVRPMCNTALLSFRLFRKNLGNLRDFFGQMVYRPPWQKISHTPMSEILPPSTQQDEIPRKYILINKHAKQKKKIEVENISFSSSRGFSSVDLFHDTHHPCLPLRTAWIIDLFAPWNAT